MSALTVGNVRDLFERQKDDDFPDVSSAVFLDWMNFINNRMYFSLANVDQNRFLSEFVYDVESGVSAYSLPSDLDFSALSMSNSGVFKITGGSNFTRLRYDTETGAFTIGDTLTGANSGATGTIDQVQDNGTTGYLILSSTVATFDDNEIITDGSGGSATTNGTGSLFNKTSEQLQEQHPYSSDTGYYFNSTDVVFTPKPINDLIRVVRYLPLLTELTGDSSVTLFDSRFSNAIVRMTIRVFEIWDEGDIATADAIAADEVTTMVNSYRRTPSRVGVV